MTMSLMHDDDGEVMLSEGNSPAIWPPCPELNAKTLLSP
jgi:hypothetical protein